MNRKVVSVIVPVYNNAESLIELWNEIIKVRLEVMKFNVEIEVIFVDDGSKDDSVNILQELVQTNSGLKIIKLTKNFGAIGATHAGLEYVKGDALVVLAADLQDPPKLISEMIEKWLLGFKFVICRRISRSDPVLTKIFAKLYYYLLRRFIVSDFPKGGFDLSLIDRDMFKYLERLPRTSSIQFFSYTLGRKPFEIQYHRQERIHGRSGWTFTKKLNHFIDNIFGYSIRPLRLVSQTGFFISTLSFTYGVYIIGDTLINKSSVPGFAALASMLIFFSGLIIVMLGIIGEYLWRIYLEINHTPNSVIDRVWDSEITKDD